MTKFKLGQQVNFTADDFDGCVKVTGTITEVASDYAIMTADGIAYWIDEDTAYQFTLA